MYTLNTNNRDVLAVPQNDDEDDDEVQSFGSGVDLEVPNAVSEMKR